jgi:hypothetical protein
MARLGSPVVEIKQLSAYSCRTKNSVRGASLSEHAFGNALDVAAFKLADGREVTVKRGWRGTDAERDFLREVHARACGVFSTVLGPGHSDGRHEDHFHLDLARHNGSGSYCRPAAVMPPPPAPSAPMASGTHPGVPVASLPPVHPENAYSGPAAQIPLTPVAAPAAPDLPESLPNWLFQ